MFNIVILTGRLTTDPELNKTQSDVPYTNFSIAVQRSYKAGEEPIADFINIVAWRNTAEFITKYFKKGNLIGIEGAIQTDRYQDKDGNNRTSFKVIANNAQFIESKKTNTNISVDETDNLKKVQENLEAAGFTQSNDDSDLPF